MEQNYVTVTHVFAADRWLQAPAAIDRYLLQTPALSSKPVGGGSCCRSTG